MTAETDRVDAADRAARRVRTDSADAADRASRRTRGDAEDAHDRFERAQRTKALSRLLLEPLPLDGPHAPAILQLRPRPLYLFLTIHACIVLFGIGRGILGDPSLHHTTGPVIATAWPWAVAIVGALMFVGALISARTNRAGPELYSTILHCSLMGMYAVVVVDYALQTALYRLPSVMLPILAAAVPAWRAWNIIHEQAKLKAVQQRQAGHRR